VGQAVCPWRGALVVVSVGVRGATFVDVCAPAQV